MRQSGVAIHTRLIDSVLNDALRIVTGCLRPTPTDHLSVLSGIQPAELRRLGATLSLAYRGSLDTDHILYDLLSGSSDTRQVRLRSRRPFVPGARNRLDNLARLGIRASEWTNHKWKTEYCKNASRLRAFVPETGARPVGMGLPRAAWVKLNRLRTGVGRFHSSMHKWGLAPSPNCKCGIAEQIADLLLIAYPIHRAPHGARGLTVLDDETRCWLNNITASSDPGSAAVWGSKRINPSVPVLFVSDLEWMPFQTTATTEQLIVAINKWSLLSNSVGSLNTIIVNFNPKLVCNFL